MSYSYFDRDKRQQKAYPRQLNESTSTCGHKVTWWPADSMCCRKFKSNDIIGRYLVNGRWCFGKFRLFPDIIRPPPAAPPVDSLGESLIWLFLCNCCCWCCWYIWWLLLFMILVGSAHSLPPFSYRRLFDVCRMSLDDLNGFSDNAS